MVAVADGLTCSCGKFTTGDDDDDGGGGDDDNDGGMRMLLGTLKTDDMHDCGDDVTDDDVAARRFSPFVAVCTGSLAVAVPSPPSTIPHSFFGLVVSALEEMLLFLRKVILRPAAGFAAVAAAAAAAAAAATAAAVFDAAANSNNVKSSSSEQLATCSVSGGTSPKSTVYVFMDALSSSALKSLKSVK